MTTYTLITGSTSILDDAGRTIPANPGNRDYRAYLAWVAAGNTPTPAPVPSPPVTIPSSAFLARFTGPEQLAVQTACSANAVLNVGLTTGIADGYVTLTDPVVVTWMAGLVAAGAITSARQTAILTP